MKKSKYWAFSERHPKSSGTMHLDELVSRLIDRVDDTLTAVVSTIAYWRITQYSRA